MTNKPIPDYWTAQEARAVFEFLDELKEKIGAIYGTQIVELTREEHYEQLEAQSGVDACDDPIDF